MLPCYAQHDTANSRGGNVKQFGEIDIAISACSMQISNLLYLLLGKLGTALALAYRLTIAPFAVHIINVFLLGACLEMGGIATKSIIALVQNHHALRDRAIGKKVSVAMGGCEVGSCPELSVTIQVGGSSPKPTIVWADNGDLLVKTLGGWAVHWHITPRLVYVRLLSVARAVTNNHLFGSRSLGYTSSIPQFIPVGKG